MSEVDVYLVCITDQWHSDKFSMPRKSGTYKQVERFQYNHKGKYYWMVELAEWPGYGFRAEFFVPIQENFEAISYEKVMEKESSLISVN